MKEGCLLKERPRSSSGRSAVAFSSDAVNTGSGGYLRDFARYSAEFTDPSTYSSAFFLLLFFPPGSTDKESRKDFTLGRKVKSDESRVTGTMVLLNQRNPFVSRASITFRYNFDPIKPPVEIYKPPSLRLFHLRSPDS